MNPKAVVYEEAREMTGFGRRVRIMAGNLQQLREIRALLRPLRVLPLFFFLSHKVSRLVVPFAMVAAFAANALLLSSPFYRALFGLQAIFYFLALAGIAVPSAAEIADAAILFLHDQHRRLFRRVSRHDQPAQHDLGIRRGDWDTIKECSLGLQPKAFPCIFRRRLSPN